MKEKLNVIKGIQSIGFTTLTPEGSLQIRGGKKGNHSNDVGDILWDIDTAGAPVDDDIDIIIDTVNSVSIGG